MPDITQQKKQGSPAKLRKPAGKWLLADGDEAAFSNKKILIQLIRIIAQIIAPGLVPGKIGLHLY